MFLQINAAVAALCEAFVENIIVRMVIAGVAYLLFGWASAFYISRFASEEIVTYWAAGLYGLPVALLITWIFDGTMRKRRTLENKYGLLAAADAAVAVALYYPAVVLILLGAQLFLRA
jgi:hypothetical protein